MPLHRQSEPILPQLLLHQQQHQQERRDVFPAPPSNYERLSFQQQQPYYSQIAEHEYQQPYALQQQPRRDSLFLRHSESTFSHDGYVPNAQEAERLFNASGYSGFNESRLSLGFGGTPQHTTRMRTPSASSGRMLPQTPVGGGDAMYETLSHYKSGWTPSQAEMMAAHGRREPPPLPPKPRVSSSRPSVAGSEADLPMPPAYGYPHHRGPPHPQQQAHQPQQQQQQLKGYSVSFV